MKKLFVIALLISAGCVSNQEAKKTAERWSKNIPDRTGEIDCTMDTNTYQYCSIFRKEGEPVSVRCDRRTCTTIAK